ANGSSVLLNLAGQLKLLAECVGVLPSRAVPARRVAAATDLRFRFFRTSLLRAAAFEIVRWAWRENKRARAIRKGCSYVRPSAMTARIDEAVAKTRTFATAGSKRNYLA